MARLQPRSPLPEPREIIEVKIKTKKEIQLDSKYIDITSVSDIEFPKNIEEVCPDDLLLRADEDNDEEKE